MNRLTHISVCCAAVSVPVLLSDRSIADETLDTIEVIGKAPIGAGIDIDKIPSNVQLATSTALREQRAIDLADFMKRNLASVFVNEAQNNPLQPDVQYRGFVGSPLLGLPQGIAVYQDGVRVNEPFGDTVNWALIPESAIETAYLMPGSNPLFGLNALGGAIAIRTKDGFSSPGARAEIRGGSFGRISIEAETGGSTDENFAYFLTGSYLEEDGWRDYSPTQATRLFGSVGWRGDTTEADLSVTLADTDLIGNGAAPVQLLEKDRSAVFTRPDQTKNTLLLVNLAAERALSDTWSLTGNVYFRGSDIDTLNGDDSDFEECENDPGFICEADDASEEVVLDTNGDPVPVDNSVAGATINRSRTRQEAAGAGLQATWTGSIRGRENLFLAGISVDDSDVRFDSAAELGQLNASRLAIPGGVFVGDSLTRLETDTTTVSIYLSNTVELSNIVALTVSGRYNEVSIRLSDQLGTALNGDHSFSRINPAIGLTARLSSRLTIYAGYGESNRVPSPVELTCADEDDPCRLPNAFLADPPLEQVVAKTYEAGVRGNWARGRWHAGIFRATNADDILFISAGALTNQGYFDNVGRTRRDGVEVDLGGEVGDSASWFASYSYLDATFQQAMTLPSPNNPAAVDGEIRVLPGDRLPLLPRHLFKAGARLSLGARTTVDAQVIAGSDFNLRGDEGNDLARTGQYAVLNLGGNYLVSENLNVYLNVDNVLDEEYETFGLLGEAEEVLGEEFDDNRFLSPAMPRAAWLGIEVTF